MDTILLSMQQRVKSDLQLSTVYMGYNLLPHQLPEEKGEDPFSDALSIGKTSTIDFFNSEITESYKKYSKLYLCYLAFPIDDTEFLIENDDLEVDDIFNYLSSRIINSKLLPWGSVSKNSYKRCRTYKFLFGINNSAIDNTFENFMDACKKGDKVLYKKHFKCEYLNKQNENGGTPIMQAAAFGHLDLVKELVEAGADLEIKTKSMNTVLMRAANHGEYEVVNYLLQKGARTDHINRLEYNVLDIVEEHIASNSIATRIGESYEYEKIYLKLNEYFNTDKKPYLGKKEFQNINQINALTLIKLDELSTIGELQKLSEKTKNANLEVLKKYSLDNYSQFYKNPTLYHESETNNEIARLDSDIFIINNCESVEKYQKLRKIQCQNEGSEISYRKFTRAINLFIILSNDKLYNILHDSCNSSDKSNFIIQIQSIINDVNMFLEKIAQPLPTLGFKTEVLFKQIIENIQHFQNLCETKIVALKNIINQQNELLDFNNSNRIEIESRNQKALIIAKILDGSSKTTAEIISSLLEDQVRNINPEIVQKEYDEMHDKHPQLSEDLIAKYCQIRLKHKIISNIAPKEVVIEASTFMEGFLFEYIFQPMNKNLNQEINDYFRQVRLKYSDLRSLTLGFYLAWFRYDSNQIKNICFRNNTNKLDEVILKLSDALTLLNDTRNLLVHDQKYKNELEEKNTEISLHELTMKSISSIDEIVYIFQEYGKIYSAKS